MSVKSQIERLSLEQRRQLAHAFDCQFSQFVQIKGTTEFVGVHIDINRVKQLTITEQAGAWCCGIVK